MKNFKKAAGIIVFFLMLAPAVALAQIEQSGQGQAVQNMTSLQNQGEEQMNQVKTEEKIQAGQDDEEGSEEESKKEKGKGVNQAGDKAQQRRSRVANAVQEMLRLAERNQGIGEQIRTVAQAQNKNHEEIEAEMKQVKNRGRLKKFFFGPDYKKLNSVEEKLTNHEEKINELKELASQVIDEEDLQKLEEQIAVMEQIKTEILKEAEGEKKGFSLFGWLNKMLSK